ncbi:MAG: Gfo/Idh/MocA family oxidoreductase [Gemmatimonadetes bacterium]|nr:Gfo/Idh/MocA family oxidoreductase [Gemmatimonadota bacterium]
MNKDSQLLSIGVLGCGPIAQFAHFESCIKARNTRLYALCDQAPDLVERMAVVHQPEKTYADFADMLADSQVEAVVIATADQFHVPLSLQALAAGKHVFVEKPLGTSVEECEDLCRAVADSGCTLQVGHMKRFDPGIAFARQFICEEMGSLLALKAWYCDSTYRYTMTDNLQPLPLRSEAARKPAGDPKGDKRRYFMLTHGSHLIDLARFLGGPLAAVRGRCKEMFGAYSWFVEVEFASGGQGHLDLTVAVRMDYHEGFHIYGEHGCVVGKTYLPWFLKSSDVECFSTRDGQYRRPLGADAHFYRLQLEGFADVVLHGAPQMGADVEDGTQTMRAMAAIARSVASGDWVRLETVTGGV